VKYKVNSKIGDVRCIKLLCFLEGIAFLAIKNACPPEMSIPSAMLNKVSLFTVMSYSVACYESHSTQKERLINIL